MKKLKRIAFSALAAGLLMLTITGCVAQFKTSELESTPNSVTRNFYDGWTHKLSFEYRGPDLQVKTLDHCGRPSPFGEEGLFTQRYCETSDGSVRLSYTPASRGSIPIYVSLTVDGVRLPMVCNTIENEGTFGCVPK